MIRHIIFDIGGVLLRFEPLAWLETLFDKARAETLHSALFLSPEWGQLDAGEITDETAIARITQRYPAIADDLEQVFSSWPACLSPVPGMEQVVRDCRKAGYHTYILSNFSLRCRFVMRHYPVFAKMDGAIVSSEEKLVKPDQRIYRRLCEKYALKPEECFFIDDMQQNVEAARQYGLHAERFYNTQALCEQLQKLRAVRQ